MIWYFFEAIQWGIIIWLYYRSRSQGHVEIAISGSARNDVDVRGIRR